VAYADANSTNRKFGAGAAVIALEAGLAWAIVTGLAITMSPKVDPRINTFQVPTEPKVKPTEPVPQPSTQPQTHTRPVVDPIFNLGPTTLPTFAADDSAGGGGNDRIEIPRVTPTPPPVPTFTPRSPRPVGNTGGWATTNDYPTIGLQREYEGSTRYRLSIDTAGKVSSCTVTTSSGHAELDATTCAVLTRRAKFAPATDETGAKVPGNYSGTVTWRLPQD
jgi:protein TonB